MTSSTLFIRFTSLLVVLLLTDPIGSQGKAWQQAERVVHPTPDNIPADDAVDFVIDQQKPADDTELHRIARQIARAREWQSIGKLEGERSEMFGIVKDAAVGPDGLLYTLDSRYNEVRIYDEQGHLKPGRGPKEFAMPKKIGIGNHGEVVVADLGARRLKVLERHDTTFVLRDLIEYGIVQLDLCTLGPRIYLRGWRTGPDRDPNQAPGSVVVHSISGSFEGAWGAMYQAKQPDIQQRDPLRAVRIRAELSRAIQSSPFFVATRWTAHKNGSRRLQISRQWISRRKDRVRQCTMPDCRATGPRM